jgi:hypothetical protein
LNRNWWSDKNGIGGRINPDYAEPEDLPRIVGILTDKSPDKKISQALQLFWLDLKVKQAEELVEKALGKINEFRWEPSHLASELRWIRERQRERSYRNTRDRNNIAEIPPNIYLNPTFVINNQKDIIIEVRDILYKREKELAELSKKLNMSVSDAKLILNSFIANKIGLKITSKPQKSK